MFCIKCGNQIEDDAKFCSYCGNQVSEHTVEENKRKIPFIKLIVALGVVVLALVIVIAISSKKGTPAAEEVAYSTCDVMLTLSSAVTGKDKGEIDTKFVEAWKYKGNAIEMYEVTQTDTSLDGKFLTVVVEDTSGEWQYLDMTERYSIKHKFSKQEINDYKQESNEMIDIALNKQFDENITNSDDDYQDDFQESNDEDVNYDAVYSGKTIELFEGMRYECFETASGEDVMVEIKVFGSDDDIMYKAEFSDGKELWMTFVNTERDGRDYYSVERADGIMSFTGEDLEVEFYDDYYIGMNGTYMRLPDADQAD